MASTICDERAARRDESRFSRVQPSDQHRRPPSQRDQRNFRPDFLRKGRYHHPHVGSFHRRKDFPAGTHQLPEITVALLASLVLINCYSIRNHFLCCSQYGNAVQDDLWDALTKQAKTSKVPLPTGVKPIMDSWTLKMGESSKHR